MKTIYFFGLGCCILVLTSCQREPDVQLKQKATAEKIMGKWMLAKYTEECFKPISTLISSDAYNGAAGDSLIFKNNNQLYTYSDVDGNFVEDYKLIDDNTIRIEFEEWKITRLTETEFNLVSEEIDAVADEKNIVKIALKRP